MATRRSTPMMEAIRELYTAMGRFDQAAAQSLELHITDLHCVDLVQSSPRSGIAIASALGLSPSAVTTVLDRLEARGFIERRASKADRRQIEVHLTRSGHRRAQRAYQELGKRISKLEQTQTSSQRARSVEALHQIGKACSEAAVAVEEL